MYNSNISILFKISLVFCLIFVLSCANIVPPSGGPQDTSPPVITEFYPQDKTINFDENELKIKFNKYMDKSKVLENISISPSLNLKFDWSGKEISVALPDNIDTSLTYTLQLSTEYTDIYNNKPSSSFVLTFSAGSKIDTGYIEGRVYDKKPEGAYIFCYNLDGISPDTLNPIHTKPNYKVQLGTSGEFKISALKDGKYRLFAIRDQLKNDLYDINDEFSTAQNDIEVINSKANRVILKLGSAIDNIKLEVAGSNSIFSNFHNIVFNKDIDKNFIFPQSLLVFSEDNSDSIEVISAWQDSELKSRVNFITKTDLDTNKVWIVKCTDDKDFAIRDTLGNFIDSTLNFSRFKAEIKPDDKILELNSAPFADSTEFIKISTRFDFAFSRGLIPDLEKVKVTLNKNQDSKEIDGKIEIINNIIRFIPEKKLSDDTWYRLNMICEELANYSNNLKFDTTFILNFKTESFKDRGHISGRVEMNNFDCDGDKYLIIKNLKSNEEYITKLNEQSEWSFNNLEVGEYSAELFCDRDSNCAYSYGEVYPYAFSEPFVMFSEEIKVKARWTLENIILQIRSEDVH